MIFHKYSRTIMGALAQTGNTIGLSGSSDTIASFAVASVPPPGGSVTLDYHEDSSAAFLRLPDGAFVEYALLMWIGTFNGNNPIDINSAVTLKTPSGTVNNISPDPANQVINSDSITNSIYHNANEITDIISAEGPGMYTVGAVPTITGMANATSGWQIIVVYSAVTAKIRNINVWCGLEEVASSSGDVVVPISGFVTPLVTPPKGRMVFGIANGDSGTVNDVVKFGKDTSNTVTLYGPNNPANNFACSQINNDEGLLDTTGTFGLANCTIGQQPSTPGLRHSFDVTNIDVSYALANDQNAGVIVLSTRGDIYEVFCVGLQIDVNQPIITPFTKTVDKEQAKFTDILTYTINLQNTGDADATDSVLTDTLPPTAEFVPGSVYVNGVNLPAADPSDGIQLGVLPAFSTEPTVITFQARIVSMTPNIFIDNFTLLECQYVPAYSEPPRDLSVISNVARTLVENAISVELVKASTPYYVDIGGLIDYVLTLTITGVTPAEHCIFIDNLPMGVEFVDGTLKIDGVSVPGNLTVGVNAGALAVGVHTITFAARAVYIPLVNPIQNSARVEYNYQISPGKYSETETAHSNITNNQVNNASIIASKTVDNEFATINDILFYTVTMMNNGNIPADNVTITDQIHSSLKLVPGSVTLNGVPIGGDLSTGINIGTIDAGDTAILAFSATVNSIPLPVNKITNNAVINYNYTVAPGGTPVIGEPVDTNDVETIVYAAELEITKSSSKQFLSLDETVTFSFLIKNTGTVEAVNAVLTDILPNGLTFVTGSIIYKGNPMPGDPKTEINLGTIPVGAAYELSFKAISGKEIPIPNRLENKAFIDYDFSQTAGGELIHKIDESNTAAILINDAVLTLSKTVDKQYAKPGEELQYTIVVTNRGTVSADDIRFSDILPECLSLVSNSVYYNSALLPDAKLDLINLGSLPAGSVSILTFRVTVTAVPDSNPVINVANALYNCKPNPSEPPYPDKTAESNKSTVTVFCIFCGIQKYCDKAYADCGDVITYRILLANQDNIDAQNVVFFDPPPNGTKYVPNSLTVNGTYIDNLTPYDPIPLGTLRAKSTTIIVYKVTVVCE